MASEVKQTMQVFGPPAEDPWGHVEVEPLDGQLAAAIQPGFISTAASIEATARFDPAPLRGPPGRLHGGLQCVTRSYSVASTILGLSDQQILPFAFHMQHGEAVLMEVDVPLKAHFQELPGGQWRLDSELGARGKLPGQAWSLLDNTLFATQPWQALYERAVPQPAMKLRLLGFDYRACSDAFYSVVTPAMSAPGEVLERFLLADGKHFSLAFVTAQLDNIAAFSRAVQFLNPMFTTRVAFAVQDALIPADQELLLLVDRSRTVPAPFAKPRPLRLHGMEVGSEVAPVALVTADFSRCYAQGFVESHPMDLARLPQHMRPKSFRTEGE